MKHLETIFLILGFVSCSQSYDQIFHNDSYEYQGCWRDTVYSNGDVFIEDYVINENVINYTLSNAETHVIYDKLTGKIDIGNENKITWNCISPITNKTHQMTWDVLELTKYQMKLYSPLLGEHVFRKVYYTSIDEYEVQDTLKEMLQFMNYLPLSKAKVSEKFGRYNSINNTSLIYMVNHPQIDKIHFLGNFDNDTIYSYTLSISNWEGYKKNVDSICTSFRSANGKTEFCDKESFESSTLVITTDSALHQITISPIRDYNYWPNISHYLGMAIQDVKEEFGDKYVYVFSRLSDEGLFEYKYQTIYDGICDDIAFITDEVGIIKYCWLTIHGNYSESQKTMILHLLECKYFSRMDGENETYLFYPSSSIVESKYEVKYEATIRKLSYYKK